MSTALAAVLLDPGRLHQRVAALAATAKAVADGAAGKIIISVLLALVPVVAHFGGLEI